MTDRSYEIPQDADFRSLVRVVSACTLGLWAFAVGLLIGVFLFSWSEVDLASVLFESEIV